MTVKDRNTIDERQLHEHEHLPEFPEGVKVPDDLSGLEHPDEVTPRRHIRWMRWMAPLAVIALGIVAAVLFFGTETTDEVSTAVPRGADATEQWLEATQTPSAYTLTQESIDQALAENANVPTEQRTVTGTELWLDTAETPSAYTLIQESIDQALAENGN